MAPGQTLRCMRPRLRLADPACFRMSPPLIPSELLAVGLGTSVGPQETCGVCKLGFQHKCTVLTLAYSRQGQLPSRFTKTIVLWTGLRVLLVARKLAAECAQPSRAV